MTRSIQQLPNNSGSTSIVEVPTNTGFSAGDLVYLSGGDYKPMGSLTLPASANFPYTVSAPVTSGAFGNTYSPVFSAGTVGSGGSKGKFSAVLTNGNIVQVWISYESPYNPYFQIVSPTGTVVVAATSISGTYTNSSTQAINVVALTGGGFAVNWTSTAGGTAYGLNYAIYTNTGSVTLAATQDATAAVIGVANSIPNLVALANGGFAIALKTGSSAVVNFRAYSSAGVAAYAWTSTFTGALATNQVALAARSDNSIVVFDYTSTAATMSYSIINSSGTFIVNAATFTVTAAATTAPFYVDATTLSDGTTFILSYGNLLTNTSNNAFRLLPTGNTLGSEKLIPVANQVFATTGLTAGCNWTSVLGLSSGGFVMAFTDNTLSLQYVFYDATGTALSGTNGSGAVPIILNGSYVLYKPSLMELSGSVYIYWNTSGFNTKSWNQYYHQISTTTYLPVVSNGITQTLGTVVSGTNGVSVATSYPSGVKALALTSEKDQVSMPMGASNFLTQIYASNCDSLAVTTLTNGNFVVAYRDSATFAVYASVYSTSLALLATITVGTSYSGGGTSFAVKVSAMLNGKFVVAFLNSSANVTINLYSSSYANTYSVINSSVNSPSTYNTFDIAGLTNDRFVFAYSGTSNYPYFSVYDNTCTLISGPTTATTSAIQQLSVVGNAWGGFGYYYSLASTNNVIKSYVNNTGTTYTANTIQSVSAGSPTVAVGFNVCSSGTMYYAPGWQTGTTTSLYGSPDGGGGATRTVAITSTIATTLNVATYGLLSVGCTGYGGLVMAYATTDVGSGPFNAIKLQAIPPNGSGTSATTAFTAITYPSTSVYIFNTGLSSSSTYYGPQLCLTPAYGHNIAMAFLNSSGYPSLAIISTGYPASSFVSLTAGTSTSNNITVTPSSNAVGAVSGVLAGVAVSSASAGSVGQVAINGPAQLNTNYSATNTASFDFTGQAVNGVKGIVNGRLVTLQGNS